MPCHDFLEDYLGNAYFIFIDFKVITEKGKEQNTRTNSVDTYILKKKKQCIKSVFFKKSERKTKKYN